MVKTDCIAVLCSFCLFTIVPVQPDKGCTYPALNNFDIYKYLGVWYEIQFLLGDDVDSDDEWTDVEIHVEEDSGIFYQDLRARDASDTCVYFKHEIQPWTKAVNGCPEGKIYLCPHFFNGLRI